MKQRLLLILFSLLVLSPSHLWGLDVDSLQQRVSALSKNKADRNELMMTYRAISQHFVESGKPKEALSYMRKGLDLSRELNNEEQTYFFLESIGIINYFPLDDYLTAIEYLIKAEKAGESVATEAQKAKTFSRIATVYVSLGSYENALDYQLKANRIARSLKDTTQLARGYRVLGTIYFAQKSYQNALGHFQDAQRYSQYSKNDRNRYTNMASIGATYVELKDYEEAMKTLKEAKKLAESIEYKYGVAYAEGAIGNIYKDQKQFEKALISLNKSVESFKEQGIQSEYASFKTEIADVYIDSKDPQKALEILADIEPIIDRINSIQHKMDLYESRYKAYENLGQIENAYQEYKKFISVKDSLLSEEKIAQMARIEHQDRLLQQESEEAEREAELDSSRRQSVIIGLAVFLLLLGGVLLWARKRNLDLRESNQLLEAKTREIKMQMERLESSNEELRQFAHVTSHDLREPLRSISSFTTLLKRRYKGKIDPEADEFINFITSGVKRMDTLLSDLLAYSVVGIGKSDYTEVNVNEVIADIIEALNREKATQGARISIQNLPHLMGNKKQLSQLFQHLIDNAIKFRKDDVPEIKISCTDTEEGHKFSIADNGIGMDSAYKDKIFGLFLRLHHKKTKYKGTGIGLSICKKIVEQHKGRIWIDSELGEGTTVHFVLPKSPLTSETASASTETERF